MSLAILYIGTGNYSVFWQDFKRSSDINFIPNVSKHYFVFTDDEAIMSDQNVTVVYKECEGFPLDSLMRFKMFLSIKEDLQSFNYTFFFNANMLFVDQITEDFLPKLNSLQHGLLGVLHPGHFTKKPFWYPYERSKSSTAYIPYLSDRKYYYFMGGVNGGVTSQYLDLIEVCANNIQRDLRNNVVAIYHDESHLNRYFFDHSCKILSSEYGWPEGIESNISIKILIRDKTRVSGSFRKQSTNYFIRIQNVLKHVIKSVIWIVN